MNDTTSSPSRLLKVTAVAARWLLGLLIGAWLLLALSVVVLHVWIVPRIGEYRGALEAQASRAIGVPVRIGSIEARSGSIFPTVELRDVVLLDDRQQEALRLMRVVASVSPRSLWRLSFEQLYIEEPQVDVRRDAAGAVHVAGLDVSAGSGGGVDSADWFFAQREVVVQGGTVRWTDESRNTEPLLLTQVQFVARNGGRRHQMRFDATPPAGWGERLTLLGNFRQPLLSVRSGNWKTWNGELFANLPYIDVTRLGRYVDLDARIREGSGGLRVWADVTDGGLTGAVADLALAKVDVSLAKELEPLVLRGVTGRLAGSLTDQTFEFSTKELQFETADGLRWPGGNFWLQHTPARGSVAERGAFRADRLDLAALALITDRLPLGEATRSLIDSYGLRGLVERIDASWQGPPGAPVKYQLRGRMSNFSVASHPGEPAEAPAPEAAHAAAGQGGARPAAAPEPPHVRVGRPGVRGATVEFDASQTGGSASASMADGAIELPGVFEDPVVPINQLAAQVQWKIDGSAMQVQVSNLHFANADAEGEAQASWRTTDPAVARGRAHNPGVLDLQGRLTRADGARVYRYLPLHIPKRTRDYVRDAVTKGSASSVEFKVRGDLHDMPFMDPKQGDFRIAARVADVTYAYVPPVGGIASPWPALNGLSGDLVFERAGMQVRNARGRIVGAPGVEVTKAEAQIADMAHHDPQLKVDAQARGPMGEMLHAGAPLTGEGASTLAAMRATGNADYKLHLELPLAALEKSKVQASIVLADNELQLALTAPVLTQAKGTLNFTEGGFSLAGVEARALGGAVRIDGSGKFGSKAHELVFRAQGTVTADGLRAAREVDWLPRLAKNMSGGTAYVANLSIRDGVPEFLLTSTLQGVGLQLPPPLAKSADDPMPLRIEKKLMAQDARSSATARATSDQLSFELGRAVSVMYVRDISGSEARVLRGGIGVGLAAGESAAPPDRGVFANLRFDRLDIAAWQALLGSTGGTSGKATDTSAAGDGADDVTPFLPTVIALRAQELALGGRTLHNVVLGGTREGQLWRANIDATELSGYAEYRHAQAGRLYARLSRLKIARSEATAVESLLDEQPGTLPALDIMVDDFELLGHRLGRAEIDAVNRGGAGREWRLNRLALSNPDATFTAQGTWAAAPGREQRRTSMDFKLDIVDAGLLLTRFGMKDVVRGGRGRFEGEVNWSGSPFSLDYPSLGGKLNINVESGQFLKADPGIAKLLGVLSLQALPRRLTLDFRDVFSEGFAFDFLRGDVRIEQGVASTNNLQMKGVNAAVLMDGSADLARETQDLRVVVVPEINAGTAALVATAINPAIGLGTFLAQMVLSRPLVAVATQEFRIEGTWTDPKISRAPRRQAPEALGTTPGGAPTTTR
jgi:uncharacterized protein (TIGR02099 family)